MKAALILPAARYAHLWEASASSSPTRLVYADPDEVAPLGRSLAGLSGQAKHALCRSLLYRLDQDCHPGSTFESTDRHACDWRRDGCRVRVRTSQLAWQQQKALKEGGVSTGRWALSFSSVRIDNAQDDEEELQLAIVTPDGVQVWRHDLKTGVGSAGRFESAHGKRIMMYSRAGVRGWRAALELWIAPKLLQGGCTLLDDVRYTDARLVDSAEVQRALVRQTAAAFEGVPLATFSPGARRSALAALVRSVDGTLHPKAAFVDGVHTVLLGHTAESGGGRRHWEKECSWRRDGARVAVRSAQLHWERTHQRWRLLFSGVRLPAEPTRARGRIGTRAGGAEASASSRASSRASASAEEAGSERGAASIEELLLALYTPRGVYLYRHDLQLGLSRTGRLSALQGYQIKLHGPVREEAWEAALDGTILPKLDAACERLAFVDWNGVDTQREGS